MKEKARALASKREELAIIYDFIIEAFLRASIHNLFDLMYRLAGEAQLQLIGAYENTTII